MRSQSLINHHAMALAQAILAIVAPCLRPEEHRDAFELFFEEAKRTLLGYEEQAERMQRRISPSAN
jgi:hypothetical protein